MNQADVPTTELSNLTDILVTNTAPSFAVGSIVTTDLGGQDFGRSVTVQADGKILLGGLSYGGNGNNNDNNVALMRYNSDGSLDTGFDGDGIVTTAGAEGNSVTVQADGKILLGGTSLNDNGSSFLALVRYNSDGSLDTSFDGDGKIILNVGGTDYGTSVAVQTDGKILLGGGSNGDKIALVRYNNDGSLDTSFDSNGIVTTAGVRDASVTVQADGKILMGGSNTSLSSFVLVRYNSNGSLDTSFDSDGKVTTDLGGTYAYGRSVTVQADGKILLGGTSSSNGNSDFVLVRYNSDGSLDTGFGIDGIAINMDAHGNSVTVQVDGKILLGGISNNDYDFALVRYNPDGSLDNSFNPNPVNTLNGKSTYYENSAAVVLDSAVQIYDAELAAQGHYNGASITLARHGGANAEDVFSGSGLLRFNGNDAVLSGVTIGTVSKSNGTLSINFNSDATQVQVDAVLSAIAYRNTTDNPPVPSDMPSASVQMDWVFNDGNTGAQGMGEALTTTGASIITISGNVNEVRGSTGNDAIGIGRSSGQIYGFAGNDFLRGSLGNDTLDGGKGNDTLDGRTGTDSMLGGVGDDLYTVGGGSDVVIENFNEGTDTINSRLVYYRLPANVENLTLTGSRSINGKGNDLANTLIGNGQDNRLSGGAGSDTLSGGLGADTFKFNKTTETGITESTRDTLIDFSHDQGDKIDLAIIDANTALKGNNAFTAPTVGGAFSGVFANPGELYFDQSTNILYGNNDADSMADFSIRMMGVNSLVAADFIL